MNSERGGEGKWLTGPTFDYALPLFDLGGAERARLESKRKGLNADFAQSKFDFDSGIDAQTRAIESGKAKARLLAEEVVPLREKILFQRQLEYNGMIVGLEQLIEAKRGLLEAKLSLAEARAELLKRFIAMGGLFERTVVLQCGNPHDLNKVRN